MKKTLKKVIALALALLLAGAFFACKEETIGEKATWYMITNYDAALSSEYYNYAYNDNDKMFKDVYVLGDVSGALSYIEGVGTVATVYDDDSHPWLLVFTRADAPAPYRDVEYNRLIAGGQYIGGSAGVPIILVKEYFANYTTGVKQTGILDPTVDTASEPGWILAADMHDRYDFISGFEYPTFIEDENNIGKKINVILTPDEIKSNDEYAAYIMTDDTEHEGGVWFLALDKDSGADFSQLVGKNTSFCGEYAGKNADGIPQINVYEYYIFETTEYQTTPLYTPEAAAETENEAETESAENKSLDGEFDIPADIPDENKAAYLLYTDFKTQTYTGTGDDVIYITTPNDGTLWVLYVKGNAEGGYFGVTGYTGQRKYTELFVNTTEPYEGTLIDVTQDTLRLEIEASCDWQIEVRSIMSCPVVRKGDAYAGSGDQVLMIKDSPDTADITGNPGENYFGVHAYGAYVYDLLVNTTKTYSGTVLLEPDTNCITVSAVGDWTIKLN